MLYSNRIGPYHQTFCDLRFFQNKAYCHLIELVHFHTHIGELDVEKIFDMSIQFHATLLEAKAVNIETTVQEKFIYYLANGW
jgi:hypothetical protein